MITLERAQELFDYKPDGSLVWKICLSNRAPVGKVAGNRAGYHIDIRVDGRRVRAHHVVWLLHTGAWPASILDHINGDPKDNRFENLRPATQRQNLGNMKRPRHNKSGVKGVYWDAARQKWHAQISVFNRSVSLGRFEKIEDARDAYLDAARRSFGEFARAA